MRILLVDDHEVVRRGLKQMLSEEFEDLNFGEAGSAAEAQEKLNQAPWDLVILDINMPGRSGLDLLGDIRMRASGLAVLVLSMAPEEEYAIRAIKKGARGYLTKQTVATELVAGVKKVLSGGLYITPSIAEHLARNLGDDSESLPHEQLSNRELQVMRLIALGRSIKEIAAELSLSEKTVFTYRDRIRLKLDVKSDVELTRYALKHRLVD